MADRCEEFLAKQESWVRALLNGEDESPDILPALAQPGGIEKLNKARDEYEEVLKQCPKHLSEYRKRLARNARKMALWGVPPLPKGARRKDDLAREAKELRASGLSQREIADELNRRHPSLADGKGNLRPISKESVRKFLSAKRRKTSPEKT